MSSPERAGTADRTARAIVLACALAVLSGWNGAAVAQKVPGTTLDSIPPSAPMQPAAPRRPAPSYAAPAPAPGAAVGAERDAEARQLADRLPLDPATANLQGRMPADVPGTVNQLGFRIPNGTATDLRNRPTTREAVIDALRH